ncbi:MAG: hypothetical protein RJQ04_00395 [Longimicrobiales bacterium]
MVHQIFSIVGAVLILLAYGLNQRRVMGPDDRRYNVMNLVGAALLTWEAVVNGQAGFILVEGTWVVMSAIPLLRPRRPEPAPPGE